jgi:hypothetical protein
VSHHCNALACTLALYARLSFDRLTPMRDALPRAVNDAALAMLCRRAGAWPRFLDICIFVVVAVRCVSLFDAIDASGEDDTRTPALDRYHTYVGAMVHSPPVPPSYVGHR